MGPAIAMNPTARPDPLVLELAAEQERILITRNSRDFAPLLREWAEAGRHHSGCILIWSLAHNEFSKIVKGVTNLLAQRADGAAWRDLAVALSSASARTCAPRDGTPSPPDSPL